MTAHRWVFEGSRLDKRCLLEVCFASEPQRLPRDQKWLMAWSVPKTHIPSQITITYYTHTSQTQGLCLQMSEILYWDFTNLICLAPQGWGKVHSCSLNIYKGQGWGIARHASCRVENNCALSETIGWSWNNWATSTLHFADHCTLHGGAHTA